MRLLVALLWTALALGLVTGGGCGLESEGMGCDRLEQFSCGCFPSCQQMDIAAIDSKKSEACDEQIRADFERFRECASNGCGGDCRYGWSSCAFEVYREVGLDPESVCLPYERDASADGG